MNQTVSQPRSLSQPGSTSQPGAERQAAAPAGRPVNTGANPGPRRAAPKKAALGRAKLATVAVSIVAFVGSLGIISQTNPQTKGSAVGLSGGALVPPENVAQLPQEPLEQAPQPEFTAPSSSSSVPPLVLPAPPQRPALRPFTRSRGS